MKIIKGLMVLINKIHHWYHEPFPGKQILRVDPLTVLIVFGLATTFWGMGRGMGVEGTGIELANELRNAPGNYQQYVENAYNDNKISAYEREVALQRVEELSNLFTNAADIIETKGHDAAFNAASQSLIETLMNYNPGGRVGSLVGASSTGKGLDNLFSLASIANSIEEFELISTPFSEEEALLNQQIQQVMGMDADALFMARVRTKINLVRQWYLDSLKENPCSAEQVLADYRASLINLGWGKDMDLFGEGEKWPSYETFIDWLIGQARGVEGEDIVLTMTGDFTMTNTATEACTICVPPVISGPIELVINLESCEVSGTLVGEGAGTAKTDCEEEEFTATGTASFSGTISGSADKNGVLSLNMSTVLFDYSWSFLDEDTQGGNAGKVNVGILLNGQADWSGAAAGTLQMNVPGGCAVIGEWSANAE